MTQEPFGDIPLFREIQRILASGEGPVNYEIARQVAAALVAQGDDGTPSAEVVRAFSEAVHEAEAVVSGYTRLTLDEPMLARVIGRAEWARTTLESWHWILERMADRFAGEFSQMGPETPGENPMEAALGQVAPLLMGVQAGTMIGHLASEALGRYDLPVPRDDDGRIFLVQPTMDALCRDYGFEREPFVRWLALQDVARHLVVRAVPWVERYLRSLMNDLIDSIEIDASDIERRIADMQTKGMEALQEGMGAGGLPIVASPNHTSALGRIHAFVALFDGYARHACNEIVYEIVPNAERIEEGMARQTRGPSDGEELLKGLLGLSLNRDLGNAGVTFCAAVSQLRGRAALNKVWDAPDNVPTYEEIKDPFTWIERVLPE